MIGKISSVIPFEVVWEDDSLFVLNKPSLIHSSGLSTPKELAGPSELSHGSVAETLLALLPELGAVSETKNDAGLAQRLDFETSGILIGAKSRNTWLALREQFHLGTVTKTYRVLLEGALPGRLVIDAPIGSPYRRGKKVRVYLPDRPSRGVNRSQAAQTIFNVQTNGPGTTPSDNSPWTIALAVTSTGRRHQVRAHAAALGYPLVGDSLYGSNSTLDDISPALAAEIPKPSFLLHAEMVQLSHPLSGKPLELRAPPPQVFRDCGGKAQV
jgi:23S rRNA-/tRNA-specific pseudouridylate synthase